ncbi:MAG: DUF58 domain-containing protein [Rhodocyclales bacterium]|nr:DUF58 domain-containing protein [Rhodocyclales bacterium]
MLDKLRRWLFRLGRDEQLPIVLTQRRIFILPTAAGMTYAAVLGVMLIGAINYNLSLGHALVFLLAGLGLVTMVHTFRNLAGLAIMPGRAAPVFAGETARFPLHLANSRRDRRCALTFRFAGNATAAVSVPAEGTTQVAIPYATERRGRLEPGRITLEARYPLGFFRAWSYPHPVLHCLVYPKPEPRPLPPPTPIADPGLARGTGGQEDFAGLRLRQPADSPRHIAWKAVARNVEAYPLLVKHFAGGAGEELWLDWERTAGEGDAEIRLSVLTGWVLAADAAQIAYGLVLPGQSILPDCGTAHRDACLEALALYGHETDAPEAGR